jgi:hypothetical protein
VAARVLGRVPAVRALALGLDLGLGLALADLVPMGRDLADRGLADQALTDRSGPSPTIMRPGG